MSAGILLFCRYRPITVHDPWISFDLHWSLCLQSWGDSYNLYTWKLDTNWDYKVISDDTVSKLWERQIDEIIDPNNKLRNKIIVGNIYRPPNNSLDNLYTFMVEFNSSLLEYHANGKNTYRWSPTKNTYIQICNCSGNKKNEFILQCHITLCLN